MKLSNINFKFAPTQAAGIAVLAALLSVGVFGFLVYSIQNEVGTLQTLSQEVRSAQEHVKKLDSLTATAKNIEERRSELDRYFLEENDIVEFLESIEGLCGATNSSVEVTSVDKKVVPKPGEEVHTNKNGPVSLLLTIEATGSWGSVAHVLGLIETFPVPITVHRVAYDVEEADATPVVWRGVFQVSVAQI